MASILLIVFILQLVIHLIDKFGASTINTLLWGIYNRLPTPTAKAAAERRRLQKEFLRVRKELHATSSAEEYVKWVKLRRQHDSILDTLEKTKTSSDSAKAKFDMSVSWLRWLATNGLRFLLQWYYAKEPMFWLPMGLVPSYGEWLLSFPRAPLGSISIQIWTIACGSVIRLVSDAIIAAVRLAREIQLGVLQKAKESPIKPAGEKPVGGRSTSEAGENKKEL